MGPWDKNKLQSSQNSFIQDTKTQYSLFKYTNTENCNTERVKIEGEKIRMRESESGKSSEKLLWEQVKYVYTCSSAQLYNIVIERVI